MQINTKMKKLAIINSIEESYEELRYKTSWPTKSQVVKSALIVMLASAIIALIVLVMDQIAENAMKLLYHI